MKKAKMIRLMIVLLSFVFLLSSCGASFSKEKDVFSLDLMRSITVDSLTKTFNEKYANPSEDGDTTTWEVSGVKLYGYDIEKAVLQKTEDKITKVCFITPAFQWEDNDRVIAFIDSVLKIAKDLEKEEFKKTGRAFIDGDQWKDPFTTYGVTGQANEAYKLTMVLSAIAGKSNLLYCWDERYISLTIYPNTLTIEYGYDVNLKP